MLKFKKERLEEVWTVFSEKHAGVLGRIERSKTGIFYFYPNGYGLTITNIVEITRKMDVLRG